MARGFRAPPRQSREELVQVFADLSDPGTREREFRALEAAAALHPQAASDWILRD